MKKYLLLTLIFIPKITLAHCPLCTVGAGALAVLAASFGVATASVGVFIGAFSLALGLWFAKILKKKYFQNQDFVVTVVIFLSTIIPIMPFIKEYKPFYVSLAGDYGTLLHNTYAINLYLLGAIIGAALLFVSPYLSAMLTRTRGDKTLPYQGLVITFVLIIVAGVILQFTT